jgi:hypothetical protein
MFFFFMAGLAKLVQISEMIACEQERYVLIADLGQECWDSQHQNAVTFLLTVQKELYVQLTPSL